MTGNFGMGYGVRGLWWGDIEVGHGVMWGNKGLMTLGVIGSQGGTCSDGGYWVMGDIRM